MKPISNAPKDPIAREKVEEAQQDISGIENPEFTEAATRANINSKESLPTLFGKIKKFFSDLKTVAFTNSYNDLDDKPTIPAAQVNSDWNQTTTTSKDYIKNKPSLATVATSGSYNDLSNKPTIPTNTNQLTNGAGFITSSGSCASATKATQDGSGNTITSTYAKKAGDTFSGEVIIDFQNGGANNNDAWSKMSIGNNIPKGTAKHSAGYVRFWGHSSYYTDFYAPSSSANRDIELPNKNGTVALTSDIPTVVSQANANALINSLSVGNSTPTDNDYYVSQYVGGGTTTTTYHRRPVSALYTYIKNKLGLGSLAYKNSLSYSDVGAAASSHTHSYLPLSGGTLTGNVKTDSLIYSTGTLSLQGQSYLNLLSPGIQCRNAGNSAFSGISSSGATYFYGSKAAGSVSTQSDAVTISEDRGNGFCVRADSGLWIRPRGTGLQFKPCAASAFNVNSSRRYKENINPLSDEEAKKILNIETVTFDYKLKDDDNPRSTYDQRGVIAEQVDPIIPYAVTLEKVDGEEVPGFVDYSKFVPYLIKMCQIQQKEINELREIINSK